MGMRSLSPGDALHLVIQVRALSLSRVGSLSLGSLSLLDLSLCLSLIAQAGSYPSSAAVRRHEPLVALLLPCVCPLSQKMRGAREGGRESGSYMPASRHHSIAHDLRCCHAMRACRDHEQWMEGGERRETPGAGDGRGRERPQRAGRCESR
jgi:hypothetical protein